MFVFFAFYAQSSKKSYSLFLENTPNLCTFYDFSCLSHHHFQPGHSSRNLCNYPASIVTFLQPILNTALRVICLKFRSGHVTAQILTCQQPPISFTIKANIFTMPYKALPGLALVTSLTCLLWPVIQDTLFFQTKGTYSHLKYFILVTSAVNAIQ